MPRETEIKLRVTNPKSFLRTLAKLGAKASSPRVHEENLIFDTPDGGLAKHGQLLRIRTETPAPRSTSSARFRGFPGRNTHRAGAISSHKKIKGKRLLQNAAPRVILTFKSPPEQLAIGELTHRTGDRHKVREEIEVVLADSASLQKIFEGLGLKGWFRYEKYRTPYKLPARHKWAKDLVIDLDETPIGTFAELEGPPDAIDRAAHELGHSHHDYVLKNYLVLYIDDCKRQGLQPTHMLFK